jgi:hypothetical protein
LLFDALFEAFASIFVVSSLSCHGIRRPGRNGVCGRPSFQSRGATMIGGGSNGTATFGGDAGVGCDSADHER